MSQPSSHLQDTRGDWFSIPPPKHKDQEQMLETAMAFLLKLMILTFWYPTCACTSEWIPVFGWWAWFNLWCRVDNLVVNYKVLREKLVRFSYSVLSV